MYRKVAVSITLFTDDSNAVINLLIKGNLM